MDQVLRTERGKEREGRREREGERGKERGEICRLRECEAAREQLPFF